MSFLCQDATSHSANSTLYPLSSPCGSLWRDILCSLCSCPLNIGILWQGPSWAFSTEKKTWYLLSFLMWQVDQLFDHVCCPPFDPFQSVCNFFEFWGPELDTALQVRDGHIPSLLVTLLPMQPRIHFCLWCCFSALLPHVQILSPGIPHPFHQGCCPATQIWACTGVFGCVTPGAGFCTC